jgi:aerobic-type carbon monoxide dehydrogenase small subunit (CoxS/CutS family)
LHFFRYDLIFEAKPIHFMSRVKEIHVNGRLQEVNAEGERTLLSVLREELDLTGTKYGCGEGQCSACTVLLDGVPTRSCLMSVSEVEGRKVSTIESLAKDGQLHPVQQAFLDHEALQCAYCASGMILSAVGLLQKNPNPTEAQIIRGMNGNICRCGTYQRIIAAVKGAAKTLKSGTA